MLECSPRRNKIQILVYFKVFVNDKINVINTIRDLISFFISENLEELYAFSYNPMSEKLTRSAGWALFDVQSEFARMGLPNSQWCCSSVNKEYQVCLIAS